MASAPLPFEKWQRNQITAAMQATSLDPRDFDMINDPPEVRLWLKGSSSVFTITTDNAHPYRGSYRVGDGSVLLYEAGGWATVMTRITNWLAEVKRDIDTPDLWAVIQGQAALIGAVTNNAIGNTPFTPEEQTAIAAQLQERAAGVKRVYALSETQAKALDEKVDMLIEATSRIGRKDWQLVLYGVCFTWIASTALPPDTVRYFLTTLVQAIGHLFGIPPLLHG